jgi:superfamily II DNA helicase RecQ
MLHVAFLSCLEFAILNSFYQEIILKPKQVRCLECMFLQSDVMCVLPTGYGKSLIFHLLPSLLFAKFNLRVKDQRGLSATSVDSIVIVVSPLNSLMNDQILKLRMGGIRASVLNIKSSGIEHADEHDWNETEDVDIDFGHCEEKRVQDGYYHIVFAHPEALISSSYGRGLLLSKTYQDNVVAIVVDEAHCIVEW